MEIEEKVAVIKMLYSKPVPEPYASMRIVEVQKFISNIMGRSVLTHELTYPAFLIEELETGEVGLALRKSIEKLSERSEVIVVDTCG